MAGQEKLNIADQYNVDMLDRITKIAPLVGICAVFSFTLSTLAGLFPDAGVWSVIIFDIVNLCYCFVGYIYRHRGILKDGIVDNQKLKSVQRILVCLILLQWNLISYLFPFREAWAFAPLYVLLSAFFFKPRYVLYTIWGLIISIAVSWTVNGALLLPAHDQYFWGLLVFRIICLSLVFVIIYILTYFAYNFKKYTRIRTNELDESNKELKQLSDDIIAFTANLIENRDSVSGTHVKRVQQNTKKIALIYSQKYPSPELTEKKIDMIALASSLHDIGKISISDNILLKPGKLTREEFDTMKTHTTIGAGMVDSMPPGIDPEFRNLSREICLYHHERHDGKGYPAGLRGEEIPLAARIVGVVDCYDALTSVRPYKDAFPKEVAVDMILKGECGVFAPEILECFVEAVNRE